VVKLANVLTLAIGRLTVDFASLLFVMVTMAWHLVAEMNEELINNFAIFARWHLYSCNYSWPSHLNKMAQI
jgi:hypothetical protein